MYPYIGILDVERYTEIFTGSYPTKEEASKAEKSYLSNAMQLMELVRIVDDNSRNEKTLLRVSFFISR